MNPLRLCFVFVRALVTSRLSLGAENLALRQQLAILHRRLPRARLQPRDRRFWVLLSCVFWRSA